jgi:hypothetical protein
MTYFLALLLAACNWVHVPAGEWEPTAVQVGELQERLKPYVDEQAKTWKEELAPWERYTIQFQGQLLQGKRVIFINGLCNVPPSEASEELVFVFDGGACYFRTYWDPATKEFSRFSFNGHG